MDFVDFENIQKHIQNPVEHIRWRFFTKIVNRFQPFSQKASSQMFNQIPVNIYLFKVNNRSTRKRCEICSQNDVINVILVSTLLTLSIPGLNVLDFSFRVLLPANIYLFKVNTGSTRKRCETCLRFNTTTSLMSFWCFYC